MLGRRQEALQLLGMWTEPGLLLRWHLPAPRQRAVLCKANPVLLPPAVCPPPVLQCPAEPRAAVTSLQQSGGMQAGLPAWREKGIPHCNSLVFLPLAFQAFSAFYYNFKFLNLTEGQSLATVRETIEHFCARTWEDVCFLLWEAMGKLQKQMGGGRGAVTQPGR